MAQSIEDKVLCTIRTALTGATPAITVRIAAASVATIPPGTVQLTPMGIDFNPASGGKRRWHFSVVVATCERYQTDTTSVSAAGKVLDFNRRVLDLLTPETLHAALLTAGAENVRRGPLSLWQKAPAGPGDPGGGVFRVTVDLKA